MSPIITEDASRQLLADILRRWWAQSGMTQDELGSQFFIAQTEVSQQFNGKRPFSAAQLFQYVQAIAVGIAKRREITKAKINQTPEEIMFQIWHDIYTAIICPAKFDVTGYDGFGISPSYSAVPDEIKNTHVKISNPYNAVFIEGSNLAEKYEYYIALCECKDSWIICTDGLFLDQKGHVPSMCVINDGDELQPDVGVRELIHHILLSAEEAKKEFKIAMALWDPATEDYVLM